MTVRMERAFGAVRSVVGLGTRVSARELEAVVAAAAAALLLGAMAAASSSGSSSVTADRNVRARAR
ncbi:MAG: hypothetical protein ACR2ND_13585, partial [Solirubrobacteraceae bacterium]